MRRAAALGIACLLIAGGSPLLRAQQEAQLANRKAQKTYMTALDWLRHDDYSAALNTFIKADKQDGGHCAPCREQIIKLGIKYGDFKAADEAAQEAIAEAPADNRAAMALAHDNRGNVLLGEAMVKKQDVLFVEADREYKTALRTYDNFPEAAFADGLALGHLKQDDAATVQFKRYVALSEADKINSPDQARAARYIRRPELVRERMAPPFSVTTLRGHPLSLDALQGKVVLIDFWATWCGPCREALPRIQKIARMFQGQPLVILSVSVDTNEKQWKYFVANNKMTWLQYRDGDGHLARLFGVNEIPHTFTIDPDGVLEDEHIGDASIEGKLKKLCAEAREAQENKTLSKSSPSGAVGQSGTGAGASAQ